MKPLGWVALLVALFTFLGGAAYGINLLTAPATVAAPVASCEPRTIAKGEPITANLITVDVYNASRTAGLANRYSVGLQRRNFLAGNVGNNPTDRETANTVIIAKDPTDPRVRLVKAQFVGAVAVEPLDNPDSDDIGVLIGRNNADRSLKGGAPTKVTSDRDIEVCLPTVPVD